MRYKAGLSQNYGQADLRHACCSLFLVRRTRIVQLISPHRKFSLVGDATLYCVIAWVGKPSCVTSRLQHEVLTAVRRLPGYACDLSNFEYFDCRT